MKKIWSFIKKTPRILLILAALAGLWIAWCFSKDLVRKISSFFGKSKAIENKMVVKIENPEENKKEAGKVSNAIDEYNDALKELLK